MLHNHLQCGSSLPLVMTCVCNPKDMLDVSMLFISKQVGIQGLKEKIRGNLERDVRKKA